MPSNPMDPDAAAALEIFYLKLSSLISIYHPKMHHSLLLAPSFISGRTDTGIH